MGKTIAEIRELAWGKWRDRSGLRPGATQSDFAAPFTEYFNRRSTELTGVDISELSDASQFPAKSQLVSKLGAPGQKTSGAVDYSITGQMGNEAVGGAEGSPGTPGVLGGEPVPEAPRFKGLLRQIDTETGEPLPELGQRGLPPLAREAEVFELDPLEVSPGPMGERVPMDEPDFDPSASERAFDEGVEGAFGDPEIPDLPMDLPEPELSPIERAQGQVVDAISDAAVSGATELTKWVGRLTIRNMGRTKGVAFAPYSLTKELVDGFTASQSAQNSFKLMKDIEELMSDPVVAARLHFGDPARAAEMEKTMQGHRASYEWNREEARKMQSMVLQGLLGMEDVMKDRLSEGFIPFLYNHPKNWVLDSKDMVLGLGHLVFLDVLGLDGEDQAVASMPDVDSFQSAVGYMGALWDTGVGRGGALIGGAVGAALAIAGTLAPRSAWEAQDEGESVSWRSGMGGGADAAETMPLTVSMFMFTPLKRAVMRFSGKLRQGTAAYRANYHYFEKKYGHQSAEFAAWKRGEGPVPPDLARSFKAAERIKMKAADLIANAFDDGARMVEGAYRAKDAFAASAARKGVKVAEALKLDTAEAILIRVWADALHQLDENSAMWGNQVVRGSQENASAVLGLGRFMSEEALAGRLYHGLKPHQRADPPPALTPWRDAPEGEAPFTMLHEVSKADDAGRPNAPPKDVDYFQLPHRAASEAFQRAENRGWASYDGEISNADLLRVLEENLGMDAQTAKSLIKKMRYKGALEYIESPQGPRYDPTWRLVDPKRPAPEVLDRSTTAYAMRELSRDEAAVAKLRHIAETDEKPSALNMTPAETEVIRRHRLGVFEEEWPEFKKHVEGTTGMSFGEAIGTEAAPGPFRNRGPAMAVNWFRRKGQSRPEAAINTRLHRFSQEETANYYTSVLDNIAAGDGRKKAEYKAYRDVLRGRGIDGVTVDYRSMGLAVDQTPETVTRDWSQTAGDDYHNRKYRPDPVEQETPKDAGAAKLVDDVKRDADREGYDEGVLEILEDGGGLDDLTLQEQGWRVAAEESDPRWTTPRPSDDASGSVAWDRFNRRLNEEFPAARTKEGLMQRKSAVASEIDSVVKQAEEATGLKTKMEMVDELEQQVFAPDSPSANLSRFPEEARERITRASEALGVSPEYFASEFMEALEWRAGSTFMKSAQIKRWLQDDMLRGIDAYNLRMKEQGKQQISGAERSRLVGRFNNLSKNVATGYGEFSRVFWKPDKFDKFTDEAFVYNIMDTARWAMDNWAESGLDANAVLADAMLSVSFKTAEAVQRAKITRFARQQYSRAPVTINETIALTLEQYMSGTRSPPALLRRDPTMAVSQLRRDLKQTSGDFFEVGYEMSDGSTKLTKVHRHDVEQSVRALGRYKAIPDDVKEYLGLPEEKTMYAPKSFSKAIQIEIAQKDMISAASNLDRLVRSTKRGLVPLNVATTVRNFMSDWSLLSLNEGNPMVIGGVIKTGRLLHEFQTGKLKRADNPWLYEKLEAIERTGLVDATFLEANFGHARFKGAFSIMTDALESNDMHSLHRKARNLETLIEKKAAEPLLKTFRASTNAFKMYKASKAYDQIEAGAQMHRLGEVFDLEVRPNRWNKFEVVTMGDGAYAPGARGYKHVATGRVLTKRQWQDVVARTSKVTSDKLFFDYNDAGAYLKVLRAHPGLRVTFGSLFGMYFAKSATIPGAQRGLMLNVRNSNPAMRVTNGKAADLFNQRQASSDMHVQVMSQGANAMMDEDVEGRRALLEETGWNRRRAAFGVYKSGLSPTHMDFMDLSNLDFHESTDIVLNLIGSGVFAAAEKIFSLPSTSSPGELLQVYGSGLPEEDRLKLGLDVMPPDKRKYYESLRKIKMKELKGEGADYMWDIVQIASLSGGPFLEGMMKVNRARFSDRPLDWQAVVYDTGITMVGGTWAKGMSLLHAVYDPTSKLSTFRYQIDDVEQIGRLGDSGSMEKFARWGVTTLLARTWKDVDMLPNAEKTVKRNGARKTGMRSAIVMPWLAKADGWIGLREALPDKSTPPDGAVYEEGSEPPQYKQWYRYTKDIDVAFHNAGWGEAVLQEEMGRIQEWQGRNIENTLRREEGPAAASKYRAALAATRAAAAKREDEEFSKLLNEDEKRQWSRMVAE